MKVEPVSLTGREVRLDRLRLDDATALHAAAGEHIFDYFYLRPTAPTQDAFKEYVQLLLATPSMCPFTVRLCRNGQPVGITTYMDIRPEHHGLEIGSTWYGRAYWGTAVNPECKYLLFRHAFDVLGALRVQLKTDLRNLHSQHAIAKLGAQREGVLRKHVVMPDGYVRDTVMYSVIDEDWPTVKAGLAARLGYEP
ncbi:MAG: GNAT family N-acetyltransferase [Chloroflexota bacterium]|nr:GNAT family N-acetyltransferase [Chloroflexota bacterium]